MDEGKSCVNMALRIGERYRVSKTVREDVKVEQKCNKFNGAQHNYLFLKRHIYEFSLNYTKFATLAIKA